MIGIPYLVLVSLLTTNETKYAWAICSLRMGFHVGERSFG